MSEILLRDYQQDAIDAVFKAWGEGLKRPAVVLPTGAGKTMVFSALIEKFVSTYAGRSTRVIVLVHRDELADQAIEELRGVTQELSIGKVKASVNDLAADVMVCSVQTLASKKRLNDLLLLTHTYGDVGLIITDECHHGAAPTYRGIYGAFPDALNLGVTATLERGDGVGLGDVWEEVVYTKSILSMIADGYLSDVRGKMIDASTLDLSGVKRSGGDFQVKDLGRALEESNVPEILPAVYREHAGGRPGLVFAPTVDTARQMANSFNKAGIPTAVISGETGREERRKIFEDYRTGRIQVLTNCMVLTEGFNAPWASCAVIARPTQSAPLYTQMVGRVLRKWPGKKDALVINVSGKGHRIRTLIDLEPGAVETVREGETLTEAMVREAEAAGQEAPRGSRAFDLKFKDTAMFGASRAAWLQTDRGVLFVSCGAKTVFLWPTPKKKGLWDVCVATTGGSWRRTEYTEKDVESALMWGEVVVDRESPVFSRRGKRWRKEPRTRDQEKVGERLGIDFYGMGRGELSDAISSKRASEIFDRHVGVEYT